jgi:hypothetical protein
VFTDRCRGFESHSLRQFFVAKVGPAAQTGLAQLTPSALQQRAFDLLGIPLTP